MLPVLHNTEKLPATIKPQKILATLRAKKTAILFKNKGKILCGSKLQ